jgi:hypothetical protein
MSNLNLIQCLNKLCIFLVETSFNIFILLLEFVVTHPNIYIKSQGI